MLVVLAYGLLIPWMGFYWDDWPFAWFLKFLGPAEFIEMFRPFRPFLGPIFSSNHRPLWGRRFHLASDRINNPLPALARGLVRASIDMAHSKAELDVGGLSLYRLPRLSTAMGRIDPCESGTYSASLVDRIFLA